MDATWLRRGGHPVVGPRHRASRVLVAGDTHGNLDWIRTLVKLAVRNECDGIVQLGDFGFWPDTQVLRSHGRVTLNNRWLDAVAGSLAAHGMWMRVIDGNHDAHPLVREFHSADASGVRVIRDGVLDWADRGAVWDWHGVRFGALGGGVSIDRRMRTEGQSWWPTELITDEDVARLIERAGPAGVEVLLTHDAPTLPPGFTPMADIGLQADCADSTRRVAQSTHVLRPRLLIHGHYHLRYSGSWGDTQVEGLASDQERHRPGSWAILDLDAVGLVAPSSTVPTVHGAT